MKYAVQMSSDAMIYMPTSIIICSDIHKLIGAIHRHTERRETA
jgi:hypothetical protein